MARVVKAVYRHDCQEEIRLDVMGVPLANTAPLWYGTVVECSCGRYYEFTSDQRDGDCWKPVAGQEWGGT